MSHLLWKLDGERYAPSDFSSTSKEYPVPPEIFDLLQSEKHQERFAFFNRCFEFNTEDTNPTGILRVGETYAKSFWKYKSHKMSLDLTPERR